MLHHRKTIQQKTEASDLKSKHHYWQRQRKKIFNKQNHFIQQIKSVYIARETSIDM